MKKLLALIMAGLMTAAVFAGCNAGVGNSPGGDADGSEEITDTADWDYIANKGKLTIGITYFEPMNYIDDNGELTGFDTELAVAVCAELGVAPDFQVIDWDSKEQELNARNIDCIWNGISITDERKEAMDISIPYMENRQVMVCRAEDVSGFRKSTGMSDALVVAEAGSAGEEVAETNANFANTSFVKADSQAEALSMVESGNADVAVIDYVISVGTLYEGSMYSGLRVVEGHGFDPEQFGVAFRKNSPATLAKVNEAIERLADDGRLKKIAEKYKLTELIYGQARSKKPYDNH